LFRLSRFRLSRFRLSRSRRVPWLWLAVALSVTCASSNPNAAKYPPRRKGCNVRVFYSPVPEVKEWDDLGMASVDCYLDIGAVQCLARLRQEACRMGGDLLYDVPKKALRPTDQGMSYRGHVAHTKQKPEDKVDDDDKDRAPASGGPVEPIGPVTPLPAGAPADAGAPTDGLGA
jgi:hypothetical protein